KIVCPVTHRLEPTFKIFNVLGWEHVANLTQRGSGAARGNAELMEKLDVSVGLDSCLVGPHHRQQLAQDVSGGRVRRHAGAQVHDRYPRRVDWRPGNLSINLPGVGPLHGEMPRRPPRSWGRNAGCRWYPVAHIVPLSLERDPSIRR